MISMHAKEFLNFASSTLFGVLFFIVAGPLMIGILLAFWLVSLLHLVFAKIISPYKVHRPDALDIVNGTENSISRPYVNVFGRFKGSLVIEDVRHRFQLRMIQSPDEKTRNKYRKFTQVLYKRAGYYYFKDVDNFDISQHIRMVPFDEILDECNNNDAVESQPLKSGRDNGKSRLHRNKFAWETLVEMISEKFAQEAIVEGKPKWEMLFIPEDEESFTALFRIHHSIIDGINFTRLVVEVLSDKSLELALPFNKSQKSLSKSISLGLISFLNLPTKLICSTLDNNDKNCLHGLPLSGLKIYRLSQVVPVAKLKSIKKVIDASINDVIFSCVAKALALQFASRSCDVPSVSCYLAINLNGSNKPPKLKNNFAVNFVKLPTESDHNLKPHLINDYIFSQSEKFPSLSRLSIVRQRLLRARKDPALASLQWLIRAVASVFPSCLSDSILSSAGVTIDVSNLMGPQNEDFQLLGCPASDICFLLPDRDPLGVAVSILSYKGGLRFGLTVDEALMTPKEADSFIQSICQEVENLSLEASLVASLKEKCPQDFQSTIIPMNIF